ncbi:hypothetical protein IGI37_002624 [Enterococcus sp. AZ194]|uniref:DMT family transporter n=1 Tax=Enterococcus sp. AZ194 TaxID=2774629 RepID=UPI003F298735
MKNKGILYASSAASFWAISGIAGQLLFENYDYEAAWLVSTRLFLAGIILLAMAKFGLKQKIFAPLKQKWSLASLLIFACFGMFTVQYTYFKTIEVSSASFATIIQYTGPFFVIFYSSLKNRQRPSIKTIGLLALTATGVLLVASKGELSRLIFSGEALFWGIGSAIALAFYSIQPQKLIHTFGSLLTVGWGMLLGSILANFVQPIWLFKGKWNLTVFFLLLLVIVLGTAVAYWIYLSSLRYITPTLASTLTAFEPVLAALFSLIVFKMGLTAAELIGFLLVLFCILFVQKEMT